MFGDIGKVLKMAGQLKTKLPEVRQRIQNSQFTGQSAGGRVRAVVNGKLGLEALEIQPELLAELSADGSLDVSLLGDLLKVAISDGQQQAADAMQQAMMELTGGMKLPGMDGLF